MGPGGIAQRHLGADDRIERAALEAGDDRFMRAANLVGGMPHNASPNTDDVLRHDLARIDLDAAAIADHDDRGRRARPP